jgi:hypothetical protein
MTSIAALKIETRLFPMCVKPVRMEMVDRLYLA